MTENTKIEWADNTWNPWTGCTKVSPGCDHCYAEGWAKRSGIVKWGPGAPRRRTSASNWRQPVKWNAAAAVATRAWDEAKREWNATDEQLTGTRVVAQPDDADAEIIGHFGKKLAGRVLDGRTWDEFPKAAA